MEPPNNETLGQGVLSFIESFPLFGGYNVLVCIMGIGTSLCFIERCSLFAVSLKSEVPLYYMHLCCTIQLLLAWEHVI